MSQASARGDLVDDDVASPCISLCVLREPERICLGCFRTLDEIAQWGALDAAAKRKVLAALPARRRALGCGTDAERTTTDAHR